MPLGRSGVDGMIEVVAVGGHSVSRQVDQQRTPTVVVPAEGEARKTGRCRARVGWWWGKTL